MEIKRFYGRMLSPDKIVIEGDQFYHLHKVLRYKVGYEAIACTGDGCEYACILDEITDNTAVMRVTGKRQCEGDPAFPLRLFQSQPKSAKADIIVQKAVELGVSEIIFFSSAYSSSEKFNQSRLERIAMEACKQCGRSKLIDISYADGFENMLNMCTANTVIMPYERAAGGNMRAALDGTDGSVDIIIGSEGGFSEEEAGLAESAGIKLVSLGKRVLRCETAVIASLALVQYERGQLGR